MKHDQKPVIGLALGSGASRGWAHIGVIRELAENGIEPDIITGCSIGSMVGTAYTAGNLDKLEEWVCSLSKRKLAQFLELNLSLNGFVDVQHLDQFLDTYICDQKTQIEDLAKTFACVATDLETGREIWFTEGSAHQAIKSSISIPGLFPPIKYQNKWLVDGALVNPVPISLCRALGADIVIAVNLNNGLVGKRFNNQKTAIKNKENGFISSFTNTVKSYSDSLFNSPEDKDVPPGLIDTIVSSMNIVEDRITRSRMVGDPPDVLLSPRLAHIELLESQRGEEAIQEGRKTVCKNLREIKYLIQSDV